MSYLFTSDRMDFSFSLHLSHFRVQLVESETVAETCDRNFKEQGIPYYRFSPQLKETISSGETDSHKLIDMVITTPQQTIVRINHADLF